MPVPKRKTSRSRKSKRSANKGIKPGAVMGCLTCQAPVTPHQVCQICGYYKGRKVLRTKKERSELRGQALKARQPEVQASAKEATPPKAAE